MGRAKDQMIREAQLGYHSFGDKSICIACVEDDGLAQVIQANPDGTKCDFCGKRRKVIGSFNAVLDRIGSALYLDYSTPEEELNRDKESDTGWAGDVTDISEVLCDIGYETSNWAVMEAIHSAFSDRQFCDRDYGIMRPTERRLYGWRRFKEAVKHERRFTFWSMGDDLNDPDHPDYMAVGKTLAEIGSLVRASHLIKKVKTGTGYWRVRVHDVNTPLAEDYELSPPPPDRTRQPNRMSPCGISMFYGAEDYTTACAETLNLQRAEGKALTAVRFRTVKPLRLLDLVQLPTIPSYFEIERRSERLAATFLSQFVRDLAMPITRDGREHIDYVPTQVFTEFVRFELADAESQPFHGIRYSSARNGRPCVVLFCGQDECVEVPNGHNVERWMRFDTKSLRTEHINNIQL